MSRHDILPSVPGVTVAVGWDNPLQTFFAQVSRVASGNEGPEEESDPVLLWVGGTPGEITRPEDLAAPLAPYATLTPVHIAQLHADQAACANRPSTPFQREMLSRLKRTQGSDNALRRGVRVARTRSAPCPAARG